MKVRIASSESDLKLAKRIDDLAFGKFQGISEYELLEIYKQGVVLLLEDDNGQLIGESQILFSPIKHLSYPFSERVAYCYGT